MTVSLIAAIGPNWEMGLDGQLPWRLKNDLNLFKMLTLDSAIIMGRKTWESIGSKPLPGRTNIIISGNSDWRRDNADVLTFANVGLAISWAHIQNKNVFVIGGAQVYNEALPIVDRLYLTTVEYEGTADTYFPEIDWLEWRRVAGLRFPQNQDNQYASEANVYERRQYR